MTRVPENAGVATPVTTLGFTYFRLSQKSENSDDHAGVPKPLFRMPPHVGSLVLGLGRTLRRLLRALPVVFRSGFNDKHIVMVLRCRIVVLAKRGVDGWFVPHGEMIFPVVQGHCASGMLSRSI